MELLGTHRVAVRAVRSAAAASLYATAASAGVRTTALIRLLEDTRPRGRCDAAVRRVMRSGADSSLLPTALAQRWASPAMIRTAAHACGTPAAAAVEMSVGAAGWRARQPPHPRTPRRAFVTGSADTESRVREITAADENCPRLILERFAADDEWSEIRAAAAANPAAGAALVSRLSADVDIAARTAAMSNPSIAGCALRAVTSAPCNNMERAAAASNPRCGPELLEKLARDTRMDVRVARCGEPQHSTNGAS